MIPCSRRTIAATTWAEYKKYFEKDAALTRRFQTVKVEEPSEKVATAMIRGLVSILELHHKVRILDEAVSEAVRLSARYIPARQLPDKAVSLIDTACARVAMSQNAIPAPIDDRQRRIGLIDTELKIVEREMSSGADHGARRDELIVERQRASDELAALQKRWEGERAIVTEIDAVRGSIEAALAAKTGSGDGAGNGAAGGRRFGQRGAVLDRTAVARQRVAHGLLRGIQEDRRPLQDRRDREGRRRGGLVLR